MIKPQKLKPCACIITHGNPSFAVCTEFERVFPEPMETPSLRPWIASLVKCKPDLIANAWQVVATYG